MRRAAAALALVFVLGLPLDAHAAHPGENGLIAFERPPAVGAPTDIWVKPAYGYTDATNITDTPNSSDIDPAWDASGNLIAFSSNRDGDFDIYLMDKDGNLSGKVTDGAGQEVHPTWSPDGSEIAFESPNPDGGGGIWVTTVNVPHQVRALRTTGARQPAWSPDGSRIAYVTDRLSQDNEPESGYLHLMDTNGGNDVQISNLPASNPDWAPDGSEIAFSANDYIYWYDLWEIYAVKPNGTGQRNVSNHHSNYDDDDLEPAWSPDGTKIVEHRHYTSSTFLEDGTWIGITEANGSGLEAKSTPLAGGDYPRPADPSWQPVGQGQDPFTRLYPRPGSATPTRIPLVPDYGECTDPNSLHVPPLGLPACSPSARSASIPTMSSVGRGRGSLTLKAIPGEPQTAADEADISIRTRITDVVCAAGQLSGCTTPAADYSGQLLLRLGLRITGNGNPFADMPGTLTDYTLPALLDCIPTPGLAGSACGVDTTLDSLLPGLAKEGALNIVSVRSVAVWDAGRDGRIGSSNECPPDFCGTGDESVFLTQGLFTP